MTLIGNEFDVQTRETLAPRRTGGIAEDVAKGLGATRKSLPPRLFYDDVGSALFSAICELPEYYVTRAETEILTVYGREIVSALGPVARLVELGSGSASKTRILLDELVRHRDFEFVPIEIDAALVEKTARDLRGEYPGVRVTPVAGDFMRPAAALNNFAPADGPTAFLFLGSTIGNLERHEAVELLTNVRAILRRGETMLLGADLRKSKAVLEAAYDDALGVTAAFNRNVLARINRELGGEFDLRAFAHRALYDESRGRIEMHLVSTRHQRVYIEALGTSFEFAAGESIHTENSYKYDDAAIASIARDSGFSVARRFSDSRGLFGDFVLAAR